MHQRQCVFINFSSVKTVQLKPGHFWTFFTFLSNFLSCTGVFFLALLEVLVAPGGLDGEVVLGGGPLAAAGAAALGHPILFLGLLRVEALGRSVK